MLCPVTRLHPLCKSSGAAHSTLLSRPLRAGLTAWTLVQEFTRPSVLDIERLDGACAFGARLRCEVPRGTLIATGLWAAVALAYGVLFYWYLFKAARQLRARLYQRFRMAQQSLQLQVRRLQGEPASAGPRGSCERAPVHVGRAVRTYTKQHMWRRTERCAVFRRRTEANHATCVCVLLHAGALHNAADEHPRLRIHCALVHGQQPVRQLRDHLAGRLANDRGCYRDHRCALRRSGVACRCTGTVGLQHCSTVA